MPWSASAWVVASGWIERDDVRLDHHVLLLPQDGQDLVLDEAERLGHVLAAVLARGRARRRSPPTSRPRPRRSRGDAATAPADRRRQPQESPSRQTPTHPHPLRPILRADDDTLSPSSWPPRPRPRPSPPPTAPPSPAGRSRATLRSLRPRDPLRLHERQLRGLLRLRLHAHEGRDLRERRRRPARDRRLRDGRRGPRLGLLRHEPRPALARRADRLRRPGAARAGPPSPRAATTPRSRRARTRTTARRCGPSSRALEAQRPGRGPRARARSPGSRREGLEPESIRLVPESVLGLRVLKSGFMAQYAAGRAFVVPEATAEAAAATMAKLRARFAGRPAGERARRRGLLGAGPVPRAACSSSARARASPASRTSARTPTARPSRRRSPAACPRADIGRASRRAPTRSWPRDDEAGLRRRASGPGRAAGRPRRPAGSGRRTRAQSPQRTSRCAAGSARKCSRPRRELPVALGVGQVAQHVGHRQALRARPLAAAAHRAVVGPDPSSRATSFCSSAGVHGSAIARRFSSSWAMSVVLGIVVWTKGLRSVHLRAESIPPFAASVSRAADRLGPAPAGHHLHGHDADAGVVERLHERRRCGRPS